MIFKIHRGWLDILWASLTLENCCRTWFKSQIHGQNAFPNCWKFSANSSRPSLYLLLYLRMLPFHICANLQAFWFFFFSSTGSENFVNFIDKWKHGGSLQKSHYILQHRLSSCFSSVLLFILISPFPFLSFLFLYKKKKKVSSCPCLKPVLPTLRSYYLLPSIPRKFIAAFP